MGQLYIWGTVGSHILFSWFCMASCSYIYVHRSRCHGNVCINDDFNSHRIIPIARRVTINPIYVRGGQSARDDKSHIR